MTLWGVALAVLIVVGTAFVWRAHSLAQSTHDVLLQILENQAKLQAGKGAKR